MLIDQKTEALVTTISEKEMQIAALEREVAIEKEKLARETETADKLFTTYHLSAEIAGVLPDLKELTKDEDGKPEKAKVSAYHAMTRAEVEADEKVHCEENGSILFSAQDTENPEDTADDGLYQLMQNPDDGTQLQLRKVMPSKTKPKRPNKKKQQFNFSGMHKVNKSFGPNRIKKNKADMTLNLFAQNFSTEILHDQQKGESHD